MLYMFPFGPPLRPVGMTAVQVFVGLAILLVILENAIIVRNRRRGPTCGMPPSTLGDLAFYTQQQDAAFYACPAFSTYIPNLLNCPILYCQANGTYSTFEFATHQSTCAAVNISRTVVDTNGEITSPNYPGNFIPTLAHSSIAWSIMTPGKNLVFRIEDFDIDAASTFFVLCGENLTYIPAANESTAPGQEITCNISCALMALTSLNGSGGRGFNISFRTQ